MQSAASKIRYVITQYYLMNLAHTFHDMYRDSVVLAMHSVPRELWREPMPQPPIRGCHYQNKISWIAQVYFSGSIYTKCSFCAAIMFSNSTCIIICGVFILIVPYGNHGCQGGNVHKVYEYVVDNQGIDTEASYPYKGRVRLQIIDLLLNNIMLVALVHGKPNKNLLC